VAQVKPATDSLQLGANQALAQAQAMWNDGSKASAIDLLRQALSRVEVASQGNSSAAASASLTSVVRELARMELADGQVNNALKLLTRLEPQIAQVADLWAMRGNSAQRLGQHAEAASSYQRALALKPDESRWLLGLAVSLAAQGQTALAAELAEKVRLQGALRPEIANYLRQLGVVIRTD
jgi:Flp pilus assembly protein TadD